MIEEGIVLYDIELNTCRNGVYTNEHDTVDGTIYNEIIRKRNCQAGEDSNDITGVYDCNYFDLQNEMIDATLTVIRLRHLRNTYHFTWQTNGAPAPSFTGVGYKMNQRQIAVHYKSFRPNEISSQQ